jgi:hypothetical protein
MARYSKDQALSLLGSSVTSVAADMASFAQSAKVLSSDHPRLIDLYAMQWVGVFNGEVAAHADSLDGLRTKLNDKNIPIDRTVIRFIDKQERTVIL